MDNDYMISLARKLYMFTTLYYSKQEVLNSEGRKLLEDYIKELKRLGIHSGSRFIKVVRKNPTLENVRKLISMTCPEVFE